MSLNPLEPLNRFIDKLGDIVSMTFKDISNFLDTIQTFFVTIGFWVSVLMFFAIFIFILLSPLYVVKYWDSITEKYKALVKRFIS